MQKQNEKIEEAVNQAYRPFSFDPAKVDRTKE